MASFARKSIVTVFAGAAMVTAAAVPANVRGVKVGPLAVLGTAVDRGGASPTACEGTTGPIRLVQNA